MILTPITNRFKLRWHITWFRFFMGIGKIPWAQKCLDRIPLPTQALKDDDFRRAEEKIWQKVIPVDGQLRLISWHHVMIATLKIATICAAVFLVLSLGRLQIQKIEGLKNQLQDITISQLQKNEPQQFSLTDGKSLALDTRQPPLFIGQDLYFPIPFSSKEKKQPLVFYLSQKRFTGQTETLPDCQNARKFVLADDQPIYYVYFPGSETTGSWITAPQFTQIKENIKPTTGFFLVPTDSLSRTLRQDPTPQAKPTAQLPPDAQVEFLRFAPIDSLSSNYLWVQVKYPNPTGPCFIGWLPLASIEQPYLQLQTPPNTLEVLANTLNFRDTPGSDAAPIEEVDPIVTGDRVTFLNYAPLHTLLTSNYLKIQVQYTHPNSDTSSSHSKSYIGWVTAGKIEKILCRSIDDPNSPGEVLLNNQENINSQNRE